MQEETQALMGMNRFVRLRVLLFKPDGDLKMRIRRKAMPKVSSVKNKMKQVSLIAMAALLGLFVVPALASERFTNNSDGTVTDTHTGLMWAAKDNGSLISWRTARSYIQKYRGGGYTDWRMPTLEELASLYDPNQLNNRGYHITDLIDVSAASCWASETVDYKAARFNFAYGEVYWMRKSFSGPGRALPVRNAK